MKNFKHLVHDKDQCSWCFDEIVNEVYVLAINKTYCRTQCMVSDMQWARSFVKEEEDEVALHNDLALINNNQMCI
jgi:hypothetical protein